MEGPSFTRLVFGKAWSNTKHSFGSLRRDLAIGFVSVAFGFVAYWLLRGLPMAIDQAVSFLMFTFGPLGFIVAAVFLWNLWLAPAELAYETSKAVLVRASSPQPAAPPAAPKKPYVNWNIWKHRAKYTVAEFAAILAQRDPAAGSSTNEEVSFMDLMIEEIGEDKLATLRVHTAYNGKVGNDTELARAAALAWAKRKKFSVAHVE